MKRKTIFILSIVFAGLFLLGPVEVHACKGKDKKQDMSEKFLKKAHFLLTHDEEMGLSDEQVDKIVDLKVSTKKDLIKRKADIEVLGVDIQSALYKDTIDVASVNALVEQKYDLKKAKTKMVVERFAALKNVLTAEQKEKMKQMYKQSMKSSKCPLCPWSKGSQKGSRKGSGY